MKRHPLTPEDLWSLPRVGVPCPSPDGKSFIVPVTTYDTDTNEGTTRLYLVPSNTRKAGSGTSSDKARVLTTSETSSSQPEWSPDGSRIAFIRKPPAQTDKNKAGTSGPSHSDQPQLFVMPVDGGEAQRLTDLPFGARHPKWFPDGKHIAVVSSVYSDALTLEKTAQKKKQRSEDPVKAHVTENRVFRVWDQWLTDNRFRHIFAVNIDTRKVADLTPKSTHRLDFGERGEYSIAPDGREIAFSGCRTKPPYDPIILGVFTVDVPARLDRQVKSQRVKLLSGEYKGHTGGPVYSPDGSYIVYGMKRELDFYGDRTRLVACNRRTRKNKVLTEDWPFSASDWTFGNKAATLYFRSEVDARTAVFSLNFKAALKAPRKNKPRHLVRGGTFSSPQVSGGTVFVSRSTLSSPPEVFSFTTQGKNLKRITGFTDSVMEQVELSKVKQIRFRGTEGETVQMFVLLPPNADKNSKRGKRAKRYPLVHMIHGGPHGTFGDRFHWRWNAQAFAAPGYVVALVNFHGSCSWGQDFAASILGRWGDQPYEDIMAATDQLIKRGLVDPKRMAATGGSYGGYLVSWIAAKSDRFACLVNHAGVCDFQTQYASDITQGRRRSMGGEPWDRLEGMDRYNPMRYAAGFKSPMLVIHGQKDFRVPHAQGIEIYNVYKAKGLPARLVVYPDESHWILKPKNSIHWYGEVLSWLSRWLKK